MLKGERSPRDGMQELMLMPIRFVLPTHTHTHTHTHEVRASEARHPTPCDCLVSHPDILTPIAADSLLPATRLCVCVCVRARARVRVPRHTTTSNRTEMFDWGGQPNARTMFPKVPSSKGRSSKVVPVAESQADLEPERDWLGPRG